MNDYTELPSELLDAAAEMIEQNKTAAVLSDIRPAASFQPEPVHWLWSGRIPRGYITFLMSPGGTGKSYLSSWIAARISRGEALPDDKAHTAEPVLYITAEDSGAVLRERLEKCGAALDKVLIHDLDAEAAVMIPDGFDDAESMLTWKTILETLHPALVVLDVWHAFVPGDVCLDRQNAVRQLMRPLARLAKRYDAAFVLLAHTTKKAQMYNLNAALIGSSDSVNAARSVLALIANSETGEKVLIHSKSNLSELQPSLSFRIENDGFAYIGHSPISKDTVEAAARKGCTAWEMAELRERRELDASALCTALAEMGETGKVLNVAYEDVTEAYGGSIWGGYSPKKALDALRPEDLLSRGISISEIGKNVKRDGRSLRGFTLSCMVTNEEVCSALPR